MKTEKLTIQTVEAYLKLTKDFTLEEIKEMFNLSHEVQQRMIAEQGLINMVNDDRLDINYGPVNN